jgi:hypothetical protein
MTEWSRAIRRELPSIAALTSFAIGRTGARSDWGFRKGLAAKQNSREAIAPSANEKGGPVGRPSD